MTRVIALLVLVLVSTVPASAFRFYGPNGYMEPSEDDISRRAAQEQARAQQAAAERAWAEEQARIQEHNALMNALYRANQPQPVQQSTSIEIVNKYSGGHYRHLWREQGRLQREEIKRLQRELAKERATPSPKPAPPKQARTERKQAKKSKAKPLPMPN